MTPRLGDARRPDVTTSGLFAFPQMCISGPPSTIQWTCERQRRGWTPDGMRLAPWSAKSGSRYRIRPAARRFLEWIRPVALSSTQARQSQKTPEKAHVLSSKRKPGHKSAIRDRCLDCCPESKADIKRCPFAPKSSNPCPLWHFRLGRAPRGSGSRAKAIRAYCIWCMNGQAALVRKCETVTCQLWQFRMGRKLQEGWKCE